MKQLIQAFPQNIADAISIAHQHQFKSPKHTIQNIVICGMGGSGIGGKIVSEWMASTSPIPVNIIQDYQLPAYVNQHSLVIGSSYSGSTEETLAAIYEAHQKNAHIIGICSGGDLQSFCEKEQHDCVIVPGGNPPRTAVAFSIVQLVNIFSQLGYMPKSALAELEIAKSLIEKELDFITDEAHRLASFVKGKVPVIYASSSYEGIAVRTRQQFNENGKLLCWHHTLPEMNHNELVGWGGGDARFVTVVLQTNDFLPRNQKRLAITKATIEKKAPVLELIAKGTTQIQKAIYLIHLVDWASYFLSDLNEVDPMDIKIIDFLKSELAKF